MNRRSLVLLVSLAALWGASYLFIKIGLRGMSAAEIVSVRCALAAIVLLPVALHRGALNGLRGRLPEIALLGAINMAIPLTLIGLGEHHVATSVTGILIAAAPIYTALLAPFVDPSERSSGLRLAGIAIGIVGVVLLLGVDLGGDSQAVAGGIMIVLAALGYAIAGFIVKRRFAGVQPVGLVSLTTLSAALLTLPAAIATAPSGAPGAGPIAAVVVLGVFGTGIAFVVMYTLVGTVGPAKAQLVAYVAPGFSVIYGATFLDESLTVATFGGLVLILAGSWLAADGRLPRRVRADARAEAATSP
ncbi:MAG TPA: EamA family transporter [Thermoleophilaceae bacterium]|nr:EamA family transporter [Thermoleophilaceae bacterium]